MRIGKRKSISEKTNQIDVNINITFYFQQLQNEFLKEKFFIEFPFYLLKAEERVKLIDI